MGALTLKSFPHVLRGWEVRNYESLDPTDSFGQETRIYIDRNQIVKIEPQFSNTASSVWLTDKGRQFFDSIFTEFNQSDMSTIKNAAARSNKQWNQIFETIKKTFYIFDICNFKFSKKYYFILVFENLSLEILNLLIIVSQISSFIKVRRAENSNVNNDLESNFQINSATNSTTLLSSSLCLLLGTNTRYEGSYLNLKLRQRYFKGNFKVMSIGSLFDLTFSVSFLGSQLSTFKTIIEGNSSSCQDIATSTNPILILNTELFKRNDTKQLVETIKMLKHTNIITKFWNGINVLNSSLSESGTFSTASFSFLTFYDLTQFSSLYFINTTVSNIANIKKIVGSQLLTHKLKKQKQTSKKLLLNQNFNLNSNSISSSLRIKKLIYLPIDTFFENNETFINTEGLIKKTTKLISRKQTKNNWQLIRRFIKNTDLLVTTTNLKDNRLIYFNSKNLYNFKNFISFQFYAVQNLTNFSFYLTKKNSQFFIRKKFNTFKSSKTKIYETKIKYWLDDFFIGGKDQLCQNSLTLIKCSINTRLMTNTFF
uniref:NADH dehydrogenase subunit 11b n=1 Tax=Haslea karadagensis TaxID=1146996 RepID=UPI002204384A|nr:NADH dehydrogenase subunit 11b [Haslea karadagensis]UXN44292.1 NADH dehydrogenase subunit 11b [Haslea karadagensis]